MRHGEDRFQPAMGTGHGTCFPLLKTAGVKLNISATMVASASDVARSRHSIRCFVFRHRSLPEHRLEPSGFYHVTKTLARSLRHHCRLVPAATRYIPAHRKILIFPLYASPLFVGRGRPPQRRLANLTLCLLNMTLRASHRILLNRRKPSYTLAP